MRLVFLSTLTLGGLLTVAGPARSDDGPRAVVARAVQAVGGEVRLSRARAVQFKVKGVFHAFDASSKLKGEVFRELPERAKTVLDTQAEGVRVLSTDVLNGSKSWTRNNDHLEELKGAELAEKKEAAYVYQVASLWPLLKTPAFTLEPAGEAKVQGQAAVGIKVVSAGHPGVELWFDKASGLLVKLDYRHKEPSTGKEVLDEQLFSDYRDVQPVAADEQLLKAAKVATDDAALLEFLRQRTLTDAKRGQIKTLIRNLGDTAFDVRAKAKEELAALGEVAVPQLEKAAADPDPEVASLAKECLKTIGKTPDATVPRAVLRLLAGRQAAGTAEVLLAYLPGAPNELTEEVEAALALTAFRAGKPDKVLEEALNDKDPVRRAAAAAALGHDGGANGRAGRRLFFPGLKWATKELFLRDGKKYLEWELEDVRFFNRFPDAVFAKP